MDHPAFNILAHPTGRPLGEREACALDIERVMRAAADRGCFLEVNAQPKRRDLADTYCKMAKDFGVKVAISTDAHSTARSATCASACSKRGAAGFARTMCSTRAISRRCASF
jgi:DNA polymerase (family 10)